MFYPQSLFMGWNKSQCETWSLNCPVHHISAPSLQRLLELWLAQLLLLLQFKVITWTNDYVVFLKCKSYLPNKLLKLCFQSFQRDICNSACLRFPNNRTGLSVLFCFWLEMDVNASTTVLHFSSNSCCCCCCWKCDRCHTLCLRVFLFSYLETWLKKQTNW